MKDRSVTVNVQLNTEFFLGNKKDVQIQNFIFHVQVNMRSSKAEI